MFCNGNEKVGVCLSGGHLDQWKLENKQHSVPSEAEKDTESLEGCGVRGIPVLKITLAHAHKQTQIYSTHSSTQNNELYANCKSNLKIPQVHIYNLFIQNISHSEPCIMSTYSLTFPVDLYHIASSKGCRHG